MSDEQEIRALYQRLLGAWDEQDSKAYGALFTEDGEVVGFDGSQICGAERIDEEMARIFADHRTARYVSLVRGVRLLAPGVAVLRAEVGMIPPESQDVMPDRHAVQSLVAVARSGAWRVALFHNTPAQFHGRPEA